MFGVGVTGLHPNQLGLERECFWRAVVSPALLFRTLSLVLAQAIDDDVVHGWKVTFGKILRPRVQFGAYAGVVPVGEVLVVENVFPDVQLHIIAGFGATSVERLRVLGSSVDEFVPDALVRPRSYDELK